MFSIVTLQCVYSLLNFDSLPTKAWYPGVRGSGCLTGFWVRTIAREFFGGAAIAVARSRIKAWSASGTASRSRLFEMSRASMPVERLSSANVRERSSLSEVISRCAFMETYNVTKSRTDSPSGLKVTMVLFPSSVRRFVSWRWNQLKNSVLSASLNCMPSRPFELICAFAEPIPNSAERQQSRGINLFLLDLNIGFNVLNDLLRTTCAENFGIIWVLGLSARRRGTSDRTVPARA